MSVHDNGSWDGFERALRSELGGHPPEETSLSQRVASSIAGRSPRRVRRDRDERQLRHLSFAAAMVFGAMIMFQAMSPLGSGNTIVNKSDVGVPAVLEFEDEVDDVTDSSSIVAALLFDRGTR